MPSSKVKLLTAVATGMFAIAAPAHAQTPSYSIIDLGVLAQGDAAQANGISANGTYVAGRDLGHSGQSATIWTNGSIQAQPNLAGRNFANAYSVNDSGVAVGVSATTAFGSAPLPVIWSGGAVAALPLQNGQTAGRAYSVNGSGTAVGSVGGGINEAATIWRGGAGGTASYITATLPDGSYMTTAFGINNSGLVAGNGVNPNNAAVNVGLVFDSVSGNMTSVGALPGANGALAFGISNSGFVVGSSMFNQGSGNPYIWSSLTGIDAIPLAVGTSQGSAYAVNDAGMVVGTDGGQYAVPFLYQNGTTYRLQDLISAGSGWDLSTNTSSSARGIGADGSIVGTGVINGQIHAYLMTPNAIGAVPEPGTWAMMLVGFGLLGWASRRRVAAANGGAALS